MRKKVISFMLLLMTMAFAGLSQSFVDPGILHTQSYIIRMKSKLNASAQPWKGGCTNDETFMHLANDCAVAFPEISLMQTKR